MGKYALIIGNDDYDDLRFNELITPEHNANRLAKVFSDPEIAGFNVNKLINAHKSDVERAIVELFKGKQRDDYLLFYFSGHGVTDPARELFFAVKDTEFDGIEYSAVAANFLKRQINRTYSERVVILLDCCFSGAFEAGRTMSAGTGLAVDLDDRLLDGGKGRYVLTSTNTTSYAWENDRIRIDDGYHSHFTRYLIDGIAMGEADRDERGEITVNELYEYVRENVTRSEPKQQPRKFVSDDEGELVIAINRHLTDVPFDLRKRARHEKAATRASAILDLYKILTGEGHENIREAAEALLARLADDRDAHVKEQAAMYLQAATQNTSLSSVFMQTMLIPAPIVEEASDDESSEPGPIIFVNYASDNRDIAETVVEHLVSWGYDVWFDRSNIKGGDDWQKRINEGLWGMDGMVSILTAESLDPARGGEGKNWIVYEQEQAIARNCPILPLLFVDLNDMLVASDDPDKKAIQMLPEHLQSFQYLDFNNPDAHAERYTQLRDALTEKVQSAQSRCFPEDVKPERKFIGRSEEFRTLRELIEQHDRSQPFQPIAIHGVAGTGKSLFAKEFLTRMTRSFDGGVLFHSRGRDTKDVQSVLREWAELIGYDIGEEVLTPEKMRKIFENRSCVPTLIVLDDIWEDDFKQGGDSERSNIQKLIDSLPPYPDSTILLTTQLREEAEFQAHCRIFSLGQLADEDAVLLIRDRLGERADGIADDVLLKLSKVVDGHPLALELVIRNMGSTEVLDEDYIESLRSSFRDGLSIDGLVTHKDANTSVGESFKRTLQGLERFDEGRSVPFTPLFRALGIFPDNTPLTKELIFEVWDVDVEERFEVNRAFKRFEDLALLNPHPDDNGDYTMHPLIAAFAREILSNYEEEYRVAFENYITYVTDEADEYFSKPATGWVEQNVLYEHIFHAGDLLWNSLKKLKGIGGSKKLISLTQPKLRRRDERDIGKIELDEKGEVLLEMALDFVQAVMPYIRERTVVLDQKNAREERGGLGWLRIGLVAARLSGENEVVAQVCSDLGRLLRWTGQLDESVEYFDASLAMMADDPQQNAELYATNLLEKAGILSYVSSENMDEARQLVEQARALSVHSRNPEQEAKEYIVLGRNFWAKGLATQALEYYEDALKIHENGWIYNKVGSGYFSKADYDRAIEFFEKGVEVSRADGKIRWEAENYNDMGAAYIYKQEPAKAREALKRALELYEKAGDLAVEVVVYTNMGAVSRQLGEYEQSLEEFAQARAIIDHVGQQKLAREAGMYYNNQGMTYLDMGRHEDALDSFNSGVALGIDNVRIKTGLLVNRGWLWYEGFGDAEKGCADLQAGVAIMEESGTTRTHGNITREEADRRLREVCDKLG